MANADTPFGLRPVRHVDGRPYNGAFRAYYVPASYGTALFVGDAVIKSGTANTTDVAMPGVGKMPPGSLPAITAATVGSGNRITGVIVGFAASPNLGLNYTYNPASTERVAYVVDDPSVLFEIQADGAIAATSIGLNAVLIATHSGSTVTGLSGMELDTTSAAPATTAAFQLNIVEYSTSPENEYNSIWNKVLVRINNHTEVNAAAGV